jgi:predicted secreted hydrolase
MSRMKGWKISGWVLPVAIVLILAVLAASLFRPSQPGVASRVVGLPVPDNTEAFERVTGPRELVFPRDLGPHPDYLTEWWYYTGNLAAEGGQRFGYQMTFFRRAVQPGSERADRPSEWAVEQVYMAHFTVTDVSGRGFYPFERFERGAVGLAGATGDPIYSVWVRDWTVEQVGEDVYHLRARQDGIALDLQMVDRKGIVLQGDRGYSRKGPEPGNASLYYSQTRLESQGTVTVNGQSFAVSGWSWLDREISTSVLSEGQVGWDWFSIQLDDGSDLMAFYLRRADGSIDPFSSGTLVLPDGTTVPLSQDDFEIIPQGVWRSPRSGGEYPARWQVNVPDHGLALEVRPLLADQELTLSFTYWEGAVRAEGRRDGQPVSGYGYVELTGYAQSMEDQF